MTHWEEDCLHWHGRVLTGELRHWCGDWDELPVDVTTEEIDCCTCFTNEQIAAAKERLKAK